MKKKTSKQPDRKRARHRVQSSGARPRRRNGRKGLYFLLFGGIAAAVLLILCNTVFFKLETVLVEGDSIYGEADVRAAGQLENGRNIWGLKAGRVEDQIYRALPEAETVKISKRLPDTLVVTVMKPEITAAVSEGGLYAVISGKGRLLRKEAAIPEGVVEYVGLAEPTFTADGFLSGSAIQLQQLNTLYTQVLSSGLAGIIRVEVGSATQNNLYYLDRLKIELGMMQNVADKLAFVKKFIAEDLLEGERGTVNITDPRKLIFNPDEEDPGTPEESAPSAATDAAVTIP